MLDEAASAALQTIVGGKQAWSPWGQVEAAHGTATMDELVGAGLVVRWDLAEGVVATLSPLAAEALGVVIVEVGHLETPRWGLPYDLLRPVRVKRRLGDPVPLTNPELIEDKRPEPEYVMDELTGEALVLLGRLVARDNRIKAKRAKPRPKARRRKGKAA